MTEPRRISGVSLIMPTYNESGNVTDLIKDSARAIRSYGVQDVEILVVDDDSPDLTWKLAQEVVCPEAEVRIIRRMKNHGLTASLNEGIAAARHEIIVWFDCDFSQPPERIPQLLYMLDQGYDVAVNSRYVLGGGESRTGKGGELQLYLSKKLNSLLRVLLDGSFHDYTSGFIAIRHDILREQTLRGDYGEYFIDLMYRLLKDGRWKICELPYVMQPRRSGQSKTGSNLFDFMRRGRLYLLMIIKLRFRL